MMRSVGAGIVTALLSACSSVLIFTWIVSEDPTAFSTTISSIEMKAEGIDKVELRFDYQTISLDVTLTKSMTCAQVIDVLGIISLPIKEKVYSPDCKKVSEKMIKITYVETVQA